MEKEILVAIVMLISIASFVAGSIYGRAMEQKAIADLIKLRDDGLADLEQVMRWIRGHLHV